MPMMSTEIVRASEMAEKVFQRIYDIRTLDDRNRQRVEYEADLKAYEKGRGKRQEIVITRSVLDPSMPTLPSEDRVIGSVINQKLIGYFKQDGVTFIRRPEEPKISDEFSTVWGFWRRHRDSVGVIHPATQRGLLANPSFNRELRMDRVDKYVVDMQQGKWVDLLSDPIAITEDGHVLNGQHRLAAIADCLIPVRLERGRKSTPPGMKGTDPAFLVIWGVDPAEALYADGSHRTATDEKTIARKLVRK